MAKKQLTTLEYLRVMGRVGAEAFRMAPGAGILRGIDSVVVAVLPIATTYFAAKTTTALADAYAGVPDAGSQVMIYVLATSAISILMLLWNSVSSYVTQKTRYKVEATVEDDMLRQFCSLPFELYDDKTTIDLHEKARRFSFVFSYIFDTLGRMTTSIVSSIGAMIALISVSPWIALAVFIAVIPQVFIQIRLARQQAQHWEGNITRRRRRGNLGWMLQESQYMAEMRVYGVAKHLIAMYARLRDKDEKERVEMELKTIWKNLFADIGEALVELGSLIWIVVEIINRNQPVGQFLFVQQMVSRAIGEAGALAVNLGSIDQDLANIVDYERFTQIETIEDSGAKLANEPEQIELRDVSFQYPKTKTTVLHDVNLSILKGQHIAIVGENGAGKSTLIKLIMGLYRPTSGSISLDSVPLQQISVSSWHRFIGLLDQNYVKYFFATIRENITLGDVTKQPTDEAVREAMDKAELMAVVDALEHGDQTYTERWMADGNDDATAIELSGGQYQRLALARNFYRDSPVVILDEPTSAIDAVAESRIFNRLFAMGKQKTIIIISHRLSTIKKADVIYVMKKGRLVEQGTYDELVSTESHFATMFESQIK